MSVHLHVRSCYTLLQSTLTVDKIVALAKTQGYTSVALTDFQVMHGAMAFFHACKKEGIRPIFGMEVEIVEEDTYRFILLAMDDVGFQSLLRLSTMLNIEEKKITLDDIHRVQEHLIVMTSGEGSTLETHLINEQMDLCERYLQRCKQLFRHFYVSVALNDSGLMKLKNQLLKKVCTECLISTAALSRVYFAREEDEESYKTLCAIDQGVSLQDKTLNYSPHRFFRTQEEMAALYDKEDLEATKKIASMCNVMMEFEKVKLPSFKNKAHTDSETYLRGLSYKGLQKRMHYQKIPEVYMERLRYELDVITQMDYADYFLIVWDFIRYSRSQHIYVGPGRGSAAGSLVSYCLGITHVDPIEYDLLFERFLNPERISMPDIDTDFPDNRRDEVIDYVRNLYGNKRVSHIITFNTLAAKQVLRDVGKTMMINPRQIDMLCRMVPNFPKVTLQYAYDNAPNFKQMINSSLQLQKLYQTALKLEGLPRHASQHAGGIVFCDRDISDVCPLTELDEGVYATQYTMEYLEELGLIKMDFLGLRNLTIIDDVVHAINADRPLDQKLDIMRIPLQDAKTYELIRAVDTVGIFQLESEGMKNLIRKIKPVNFEDIVTTIALFRPGPMENIPEYLRRREHPETIDYIHPDFEKILKNTYGIMIYQEQIMQIAQKMAGFSLAKADNLRKAISKKHEYELVPLKQDFIEGAVRKGYEKKLAEHVYDLIMKFANYGFNRSHSVAYGMVAYQLAYLKANAPLYFFRSLLNSVIGSETKTSEYVFEAKKRQISILPPSVQHSTQEYTIEKEALRLPLTGIKNIGSNVCGTLLEERAKQLFSDYFDFVARVSYHGIGKKTIETLIDAGAMDVFGMGRASMNATLDSALTYANIIKIDYEDQITLDFNLASKPVPVIVREDRLEQSEREKELIGFYLSNHPISDMRNKIDPGLSALIELRQKTGFVRFLCQIERTRQHRTKNGDLMMFVVVNDETGKFDLVCMPNIYQQYQGILMKGNYLLVEGKIDKENSCLARKLTKIETHANM